jgi:hypothetical protein
VFHFSSPVVEAVSRLLLSAAYLSLPNHFTKSTSRTIEKMFGREQRLHVLIKLSMAEWHMFFCAACIASLPLGRIEGACLEYV